MQISSAVVGNLQQSELGRVRCRLMAAGVYCRYVNRRKSRSAGGVLTTQSRWRCRRRQMKSRRRDAAVAQFRLTYRQLLARRRRLAVFRHGAAVSSRHAHCFLIIRRDAARRDAAIKHTRDRPPISSLRYGDRGRPGQEKLGEL